VINWRLKHPEISDYGFRKAHKGWRKGNEQVMSEEGVGTASRTSRGSLANGGEEIIRAWVGRGAACHHAAMITVMIEPEKSKVFQCNIFAIFITPEDSELLGVNLEDLGDLLLQRLQRWHRKRRMSESNWTYCQVMWLAGLNRFKMGAGPSKRVTVHEGANGIQVRVFEASLMHQLSEEIMIRLLDGSWEAPRRRVKAPVGILHSVEGN
jgi:hypothetical protein